MNFRVKFSEQNSGFVVKFGEVHNISDGAYERGYSDGQTAGYNQGHAEGLEEGRAEGYAKGFDDGLAERKYEVWSITLVDGSVIEKEVALL